MIELKSAATPKIDPQKLALLIIDMQEYQVRKDWTLYKYFNSSVPGFLDYFVDQVSQVAEPNIKQLVELFREKNMKIIYTMFSSFNKDGSDLQKLFKNSNQYTMKRFGNVICPFKDHPSSQIIDSIKPQDVDFIVIKNTSGVFISTHLEQFLQNMGIKQLFVVGVVTNICVEGAARTAYEFGFDVFIIEDACAAWSPEIHKNTLRSFEMAFGSVITTDEAIRKIKEKFTQY